MTGEEALHALLVAVQSKAAENSQRDVVLMKQLESVFKRALGIPEQEISEPKVFRPPVRGEFPKWRLKIEGGKEIARRPVYSLYEEQALQVEDPLFSSVDSYTPVPPREG